MPEVWTIEDTDYDPVFWGVAATPEAAVEWFKVKFGPPYIVEWDEPERGADEWFLTGHFESVPGYAAKHDATIRIQRHPLIESLVAVDG